MNKYLITSILLVLILFTNEGCKSHKKATAITNTGTEKTTGQQRKDEDDLKRREAEEMAKLEALRNSPKVKLNQYFEAIANADNVTSANNSINEALTLFASSSTPVLIVISEEAGNKDYDRPTSIKAYLNYLKDQKKNSNRIESVKVDDQGKITELELRKIN